MAGEKLARLIKQQKINEMDLADFVFGQVTSISPMKIMIDNRFEITEEFIMLSPMVQKLTVGITEYYTVFEDLKVGDNVVVLRGRSGQLYYVLNKVV